MPAYVGPPQTNLDMDACMRRKDTGWASPAERGGRRFVV
jgi:hypothetical protein